MKDLIKQLQQIYGNEIGNIEIVGNAEISLTLKDETNVAAFSQTLQDHLVSALGELEIIKINIVDTEGNVLDSFASNQ